MAIVFVPLPVAPVIEPEVPLTVNPEASVNTTFSSNTRFTTVGVAFSTFALDNTGAVKST